MCVRVGHENILEFEGGLDYTKRLRTTFIALSSTLVIERLATVSNGERAYMPVYNTCDINKYCDTFLSVSAR